VAVTTRSALFTSDYLRHAIGYRRCYVAAVAAAVRAGVRLGAWEAAAMGRSVRALSRHLRYRVHTAPGGSVVLLTAVGRYRNKYG